MKAIFDQLRRLVELRSLWLLLYIIKASLAFLMTLPLFVVADSSLSTSILGRNLLSDWDLSVIVELFSARGDAFSPLLMTVFAGAVLYIVLMQFVNGGLYYTLVSRKFKIEWGDFFAECGMNFGINVKITLIMLIVYALLLPAGMFFVNFIGIAGGHIVGTPALLFMLFKVGIMLVILTSASIFSDSARAAAAANPDKGLREILRIGSEYFKPRLIKLLAIFIITYLPFVVIWLLVEWLALVVTGGSGGMIGVIIEFILFQVAALSRTGQKLWYLAVLGRDFHAVYPGRFIPEQVELELGDK